MRAGLSTIQQTLTPEAASVLNHSIAEAGRRNHGQTTPLHVAATLLASPSGFLRQACIKSHPNSSHPLQCRALELCFSVALERLPTAQNMSPGMEPPISNALMAALKRAQAHQRRGCPEQQQQPLLAVKVELEQLIISILDDPSVSRVMREASFSSPAVKATIEQSLNSSAAAAAVAATANSAPIGLGFRPGAGTVAPPSRNLYLNPRLQQQGSAAQSGQQRGEEVKRVLDLLVRAKKRNPVLVGDSEPEAVMKELLKRIENGELGEGSLRDVDVIHLEKELSPDRTQILGKMKELTGLVEARIAKSNGGGVILNLGDLKWLVEQPPVSLGGVQSPGTAQQQVVSEAGRAAVAEMGKLLAMFGDGGPGRLWLIGTATCETYLRCQVYHPSMENDWDLQAVPIAARAPVPGLFPRLGTNGILSSSVESLSPLKGFPTTKLGPPRRLAENLDPSRRTSCCPQCNTSYEQELSKLIAKESGKSSSSDVKSEGADRPALPQWLQNAKTVDQTQTRDQELVLKQKTQELQKKWNETCLNLHPSFHHHQTFCSERIAPMTPTPSAPALSMTGLYNPNLLGRQPFQPKLQMNKSLGETLQLNTNPVVVSSQPPSEKTISPPGSPVRTELVLGQTKVNETSPEQTHKERIKDLIGCISSEQQNKFIKIIQRDDKIPCKLDADSFKRISKGLAEKVWWQPDAADRVAATMTEKLGNGKRRGAGSKGDMWLLFIGPDRVGKKKMAAALSELVSGSSPVLIGLGSRRGDGESVMSFRGKTVVDRIAEAVRRNPFSVIVLEDINEADMLVRGSIKRAMERGRLADSHGREIGLGNVVFILTADWLPENVKCLSNGESVNDEKLAGIARKPWQLRLSVSGRTAKRRAHWLNDDQRPTKPRKEASGLAFDLNELAASDVVEEDKADGSHNSSDLTVDHEEECGLINNHRSALLGVASSMPRELLEAVDGAIVFKAADSHKMRSGITSSIAKRFSAVFGDGISLEVDEDAAEKILSGIWVGRTSLEEWTEKVLVPSFDELKLSLSAADESMVVRLEADCVSDRGGREDWLPVGVKVVVADA
ncbi:Butenolide signaling repressing protein-like [Parasponia andersonii]|uniref:Butenolide signaling repressing protein-like n=1 Tax=Parasponia andersonii TaxID=3476 RepID=A0A2P5B049_PARAD|nr:Butenolide signaling repressing protein-like [Parasponia andersonii]